MIGTLKATKNFRPDRSLFLVCGVAIAQHSLGWRGPNVFVTGELQTRMQVLCRPPTDVEVRSFSHS